MTAQTPRRLALGAHVQGTGPLDFSFYADLARTLERGRFDTLFIDEAPLDERPRTEPLTLLAALALVTEHIGLAATATTTWHHPFPIARKLASLDHLSGGRAGWNTVTSEDELHNRRADEFLQVVKALWDSFDDDAVIRDKAGARYYDPAGLHTPHHRGEHFSVRGPLNISRPPQGHPVVFQAGSAEQGREFAARHAEVLFTEVRELGAAQAYYADVKARAVAAGRDPAHVLVWSSLTPFAAPTETPERIADHIETWFRAYAADGFHLAFPQQPGVAEEFVDDVIPLLQQRGLFRTEYEGTTLRENLGLPRPVAPARQLQEAGR
ncbi:LLM class flavin-dependent oxidoreductase [Streptomyces sp. NPDC046909]|uniref:LLM class flavin-dependent oxidoreductase n=1 Tax=Streptomyces sp. NPDC046909 TaxID=3155617 RepID=UPI0033F44F15